MLAYPLVSMLRVHVDGLRPPLEESLCETTILRQFAGFRLERIPDETTLLGLRRLQEKYELAAGIFAFINSYLCDRGLSLRQSTMPRRSMHRVRPRTRTASETRKYIRPRKATSISSA